MYTFVKATLAHKSAVLQWLQEPHVREFWDTSQEHQEDIIIFMQGRKRPTPYFEGIFDYWIGLIDDAPYCLIMTSEILPNTDDLPEHWQEHLSTTGKTYTIDFMIGSKEHLGKGLAAPSLDAFTQFFHDTIDNAADTFFIDPAAYNTKAIHVYTKGGFKQVATFKRDFVNQKEVPHVLMVKKTGKIS